MAMRYWIGVAVTQRVMLGRARGICAFGHGKHSVVARLLPGGPSVCNVTNTRWENGALAGDLAQPHLATATVKSEALRKFAWDSGTAWVKNAHYDAPFHRLMRPLLDRLRFVRDPQYLRMVFQCSRFAIPKSDFDVITEAAKNG